MSEFNGSDSYLQLYLDLLKEKFLKGALEDDDFRAEKCVKWSRSVNAVSKSNSVDSLEDSDCELDFENGQVLLRKPLSSADDEQRLKRELGNTQLDDKTMKRHLCMLMDTFEDEKRKLDTKLQEEKVIIRKRMQHLYSKKIQVEREHYGRIITDLIRLVDESKVERDRLSKANRQAVSPQKEERIEQES